MSDTAEKIGSHEVAAWLRRHPTFLKQFPDLALTLVVPRDDGPTASLASYQLEVLRDKNRELSRRLADLAANAQINERLAVRTHQLTLALMKQDSAADTLRAMAASLEEDFAGDLVRLIVLHPVAGLEQAPWLQVIEESSPLLGVFRDCLKDGEPICGRLQPEKKYRAVRGACRGSAVQRAAAAAGRRPDRGGQPRRQPVLPRHGHVVPAHDGRVAGRGAAAFPVALTFP